MAPSKTETWSVGEADVISFRYQRGMYKKYMQPNKIIVQDFYLFIWCLVFQGTTLLGAETLNLHKIGLLLFQNDTRILSHKLELMHLMLQLPFNQCLSPAVECLFSVEVLYLLKQLIYQGACQIDRHYLRTEISSLKTMLYILLQSGLPA